MKKNKLESIINQIINNIFGIVYKSVADYPKIEGFGDYSTNAAFQLSKVLKKSPKLIAEQLSFHLCQVQEIEKAEVAGSGFVNIFLHQESRLQILHDIQQEKSNFGFKESNGKKVILEYVSANPTGPLHIGHGRQAALGNAIGNLLESQGYDVHHEFFYNDGGNQIKNLALSVQARMNGLSPQSEDWQTDWYNGDYIQDIAIAYNLVCKNKNDLIAIKEFAVDYLRKEQNKDLGNFGIHFDQFYLESSLYESGKVNELMNNLDKNGLTYQKDGATWFQSTGYGDDKDRVMQKQDGSYTYFVPDVAYHLHKWERGFTKAINIQGTDHHGTVCRVRAGIEAGNPQIEKGFLSYILHTMVKVVKDGEEVKISKRSGGYVTLSELIEWTSSDFLKFFLLSYSPETEFTFDVDVAIKKNHENPVFYVQYAYARICSILSSYQDNQEVILDLKKLNHNANPLIKHLNKYIYTLEYSSKNCSPLDIIDYVKHLASLLHSYYDKERVLVDDAIEKKSKIYLLRSVAEVIKNCLCILGISAPESMYNKEANN